MSRKANPTIIGIFVVTAVALLSAAIIILGGGKFFRNTREWVLHFDGSVKGLSSGSAVVFQGVRIGEVRDIRINIDREGRITTPVIIQLDSSLIDFENKDINAREEFAQTKKIINRGLRAQLQTQSFITGQLLIQLSFHPDREAVYRAPDKSLPEIPTIPSTIEELSQILNKLPLDDIVNNIHSLTENLDQLMKSAEIKEGLALLNDTLKRAESLMLMIEDEMVALSKDARTVLKSTDKLITDNNGRISSLLDDLEKTSRSTRESVETLSAELKAITGKTDAQLTKFLETATITTEQAGNMIAGQSDFRGRLNETLEELNSTLRAVRLLAEHIEQHPESIIRGKRK